MSINHWLRHKARRGVDGLFCSSSPNVRRMGDIHSGWVLDISKPRQVVYCAGVGLSMSLELELARAASEPILVFDPSPTGIETIANSDTTNIKFQPIGLAGRTSIIEFAPPASPSEGSYSLAGTGGGTVSFECQTVPSIMSEHGHTSIDLLKLDIEGFEYEVIAGLLDQGIPVRQLCVEFHPWIRPGKTVGLIRRLYGAGYRIIYKHRGDYSFVMPDERYRKMLASAPRPA